MKIGMMLWGAGLAALLGAGWIGGVEAPNRTHDPTPKVLLFLSTDCPVAMQYTPRLNKLAQQFGKKIAFEALFPNEGESVDAVGKYAKERGYTFSCELDPGGKVARSTGVTHVPTAVLVDATGKVVYRGAIDDNRDGTRVKRTYLKDAIEAVLTGKTPTVGRTEPFGCLLMAGPVAPSIEKVNFAEHVAPIVYNSCTRCHRPGEAAPFALTNYDEVRKWADMIALVTEQRKMPPWKAKEGFGEFHDPNVLSAVQVATLKNWAAAKAPRGDAKKEPKPPTFRAGWSLGEPDLILQPKRAYKTPAEGSDVYRHFVIEPKLGETVWVKGMDVRPGNRKIVHHVICFLDTQGASKRLEARSQDGQEGYTAFGTPGFIPNGALGGWAPGLQPYMLPEGTAFELKPGTRIVMQVHYHLNGKEEEDRTQVALYFAKKGENVARVADIKWLANPFFRLKAGDKNAVVKGRFPVRRKTILYGLMPHMHLLGKSMKAEVVLPDGTRKPLIWVENWDFNWQLSYALKEPMRIPGGSVIEVEAVYDNSATSPFQPNNPPKDITWGEETTDEMFLLVAVAAQDD